MAIADYYTPDKKTRLDKIGVSPDIEVPEKEALEYVIKLIETR
jgi:C-terminal processing protease CtpA/Prc